MLNEISQAFKNNAFIPFIVAADPNYQKSLETAKALIDAGADVLEIGIPYTDPAADGPTIQKAYSRALKNGFEVKQIFKLVKEIKKYKDIPIVVLTYYNIVYNQGIDTFYEKAKESKINGVIIADMPIEESDEVLTQSKQKDIHQIFLVSPNSTKERIKKIEKKSEGFIYTITRLGVTGKKEKFLENTRKTIQKVKSTTDLPIAAGFGISKPKHAEKAIKAGADGVIVGSAIVEKIQKNHSLEQIKNYVEEMKKAINKI
ncbi:tryptophan synthase subunit alpha [archaeon SCG-AAA382B04]|nr:tryptophan synthase subunit alpha [archaeon SCG-AAA382B04]